MCQYDYDNEVGYQDYVECSEVKALNDKLCSIERAMAVIVKQLYMNERLDVAVLDDAVGQICDSIGYPMPETLPRIRRAGSDIFEFALSMNQ